MTKKQIAYWSEKYDVDEDQYSRGLEKEIGEELRRTKELTKDELGRIIEWKFQGRLLGRRKHFMKIISGIPDDFIRKVSGESFAEQDDRSRIRKLMGRYGGIKGVGFALASVILAFYYPERYGVYDIHAWRELFETRPADLFTNFENLVTFLERLRSEAKIAGRDVRTVEKAYFKKNLDESKAAKPRPGPQIRNG